MGFSFVLARNVDDPAPVDPSGIADYCLMSIGGRTYEAELSVDGHFRVTHDFSSSGEGDRVVVRAAAFRQRGRRDRMKVGDEWIIGADPYDHADHLVADDELEILIYKSRIDLPVKLPGSDLSLAAGKLEIGTGGKTVTVLSEGQRGSGYTHAGPDDQGHYHVLYEPLAEQLHKSGTTPIRFTVPDSGGREHVTEAVVYSP